MHLHFANLVDDEVKDMFAWDEALETKSGPWEPKCCFPPINKDVLFFWRYWVGKLFQDTMITKAGSITQPSRHLQKFSLCRRTATLTTGRLRIWSRMQYFLRHGEMVCKAFRSMTFFACLLGEIQDECEDALQKHPQKDDSK